MKAKLAWHDLRWFLHRTQCSCSTNDDGFLGINVDDNKEGNNDEDDGSKNISCNLRCDTMNMENEQVAMILLSDTNADNDDREDAQNTLNQKKYPNS